MTISILMDKIICEFYRKKIILHGNFVLKSGQESDIYINCRKISEYPQLMKMICDHMKKDMIKAEWVCGVPYGAVPFATTLSLMTDIPQLILRKEKKDHGTGKQIEGEYRHGDTVILVEDVITTGGSLNKYAKLLEDSGLNVIMKKCIINRGNVSELEPLIPFNELMSPNNILLPKLDKKIIWAADVNSMKELFTQLDVYGPKIGILKLHIDTFKDFSLENLLKLQEYKERYNLLIWEDRKFADIGNIMVKQIKHSTYCYEDWVDIFSIHCITGFDSVNAAIETNPKFKWILIGQLSSSENLITSEYTERCKEIYKQNINIIGMVCQEYLGPEYIHIVPGISKHVEEDNQGQKYSTVVDKAFADFFVVGRSISKFFPK
mgnify:CR=1 FL=1